MSISVISPQPPIPVDDIQDTPLDPRSFDQRGNPFTPQKRENTTPMERLQQISSKTFWKGHDKHRARLEKAHKQLIEAFGTKQCSI